MAVSWRLFLPWLAPVVAMAAVSVTISLTVPLYALLLEGLGVSGGRIGMNHMFAAAAMVASAPVLPLVMMRIGLIPMMLGSVLILVVTMLVIPLWHSEIWWGGLRLLSGAATTALFFGSEFWIVKQAPDAIRGRIIGLYIFVLSASYMAGPLVLNAIGLDGYTLYAVAAAMILAAAIPIWLGRFEAPETETEERPTIAETLRFFVTDPMVIFGVVLFGVIEFGGIGLIAVWGLRVGFTQSEAIVLVFWIGLGSLMMQPLISYAAEKIERRAMLAGSGLASLIVPLAIIAFTDSYWIIASCLFVWGGTAVAFYSLALIELGARYRGDMLAKANAAVVLAYGLGALASPTLFGMAMDMIPPNGLLWLAACSACAYLVLAAVRMSRPGRDPLDSDAGMGT